MLLSVCSSNTATLIVVMLYTGEGETLSEVW